MTCPTPIKVKNPNDPKEYNTVPCGRCYACLENKRTDWRIRLTEELKGSKSAIFVTLTYSDSSLEYTDIITRNKITYTKEYTHPIVHKRTIQNYIKRLRKLGLKFRYYAVGEYGTKSKRPHYHIIFFNLTK